MRIIIVPKHASVVLWLNIIISVCIKLTVHEFSFPGYFGRPILKSTDHLNSNISIKGLTVLLESIERYKPNMVTLCRDYPYGANFDETQV